VPVIHDGGTAMRFKYLNTVLLTMFLLTLVWTGKNGVSAQSNIDSPPPIEQQRQTGVENQPTEQASSTVVQQSRFKAWFNRSGSGLFISLTPFATAVTLAVLLLVILIPILMSAKNQKRAGYFKTIPYAR
jgi:hypothetical protein